MNSPLKSEKSIARHVEGHLADALADSPAVLINGPRQCGKTTLALKMSNETGHRYYTFDDENTFEAASADPVGFVSRLPRYAILDEVQRVPNILHSLKLAIDADRAPGRFILTGSANILRLKNTRESLAGRMDIIDLHPFSQCEMEEVEPRFLDRLFKASFPTSSGALSASSYAERIVAGGYPPAVARESERRRINWYASYVREIMQHDTLAAERIRTSDSVLQMLEVAAVQTAQLIKIDNIANLLSRQRPTVESHLSLLESLFLVERLPAYANRRLARLVKAPKIHLCDTGIACRLIGANSARLDEDTTLRGHILETFVFRELKRQASGQQPEPRFYHYRNRDDVEVDVVVEQTYIGKTAGIEVKSSSTVDNGDFRGLRQLRDSLGKRFACGAVVYEGNTSASFGDRLYAVPLRFLWEPFS